MEKVLCRVFDGAMKFEIENGRTQKRWRERESKKSGLWVFSFIGTIIMTAHLHSIYYNDENLYELQCPVFIVRVPMLPPA